MTQRILYAFVLLGLLLGYSRTFEEPLRLDPDRYFHLAMARMSADHGLVKALPQVEDLGWEKGYPNQSFLYSAVGGLLYRIGGERLALGLTLLLWFLTSFLLYEILKLFIEGRWAMLFSLLPLLFPGYVFRFLLFRPHVLAVFWFLLLLFSLLKSSPRLALIAGTLFSLSYQVLLIPMVTCLTFFAAGKVSKSRDIKTPCFGLLGVALGILINPYFPLQLKPALMSLAIAFNDAKLPEAMIPIENRGLSFSHLFYFLPLILIPVLSTMRVWKRRSDRKILALWALSLGFWSLTYFSRRTLEYAVPCSVLLLACFLKERAGRWLTAGVACAGLIFASLSLTQKEPGMYDLGPVFEVLEKIPRNETSQKIYTCSWSLGAFLLYRRPDVHFVDILDPAFLLDASREKFLARVLLENDQIAFPFGIVKNLFHASLVLCDRPGVLRTLERDPHFFRLYPTFPAEEAADHKVTTFLYEVSESVSPAFIRDFEVKTDGEWKVYGEKTLLRKEDRSPYLFLQKAVNKDCVDVKPNLHSAAELARKDLLGIGGGEHIEVSIDGKRIFKRNMAESLGRTIQYLVPLRRPLSKQTTIVARVCGSSRLGVALSLWNRREVNALCQKKYAAPDCLGEVVGE